MDRIDDYAASRFLAQDAKSRPKKYMNSSWKYYDGYYRGSRYGTPLPGTIYYTTQAWGSLKKCWLGYEIAKSKLDTENMIYYARGIRKFQRELNIPVSDFPQLGLTCEFTNENELQSDTCVDEEFGQKEDDAKQTTTQLELSSDTNEDDIEQDSYGYESEAQRTWRERMQKYY